MVLVTQNSTDLALLHSLWSCNQWTHIKKKKKKALGGPKRRHSRIPFPAFWLVKFRFSLLPPPLYDDEPKQTPLYQLILSQITPSRKSPHKTPGHKVQGSGFLLGDTAGVACSRAMAHPSKRHLNPACLPTALGGCTQTALQTEQNIGQRKDNLLITGNCREDLSGYS